MLSSKSLNHILVVILLLCFAACKKEVQTQIQDAPPFATAGTNQSDVTDFQVQLNADSLKAGQTGKWTIVKGLVEEKVYFADANKPVTKFNGMPGEIYELKWTVMNGPDTYSEATVKIGFKPLKAIIDTRGVTAGTRFNLAGNRLDDGKWTIIGKYATVTSQNFGGTYVPDLNSGAIRFQGYANTKYAITWTTYYGSKSADTTVNFTTGDYLESEALEDLQIQGKQAEIENGHVTKLHLNASAIAWIFQDTVRFPALQALTHLKWLDLSGSSLIVFPAVFGNKYKNLEYLNIQGTAVSVISETIGQLTKLKQLYLGYPNYEAKIRSLPESFGNLESLEYFTAVGIGLEDIPESFSKLKNLRYFGAELNPVRKLPNRLGDLSNLQTLRISTLENIPASVSKLKNLNRLLFGTASTSAQLPEDFGNLTSLDTLELAGAFRELPNSFGNLNVRDLDLSAAQLASLPSNFGNLKKLEVLQVGGPMKTLPASFTSLPNLRVWLNYTAMESLPKDIGKLKSLEFLSCEHSKLKDLPESIGDLDNLTELRLQSSQIASLPAGFFNLKKIERIDLGVNKLTNLSEDFGKLKNTLKYLIIWYNPYPVSDGERIKTLLPTTVISQ